MLVGIVYLGLILIAVLLSVLVFDRRYKASRGDPVPRGFKRTDEVAIDPIRNVAQRVYYNETTGERMYLDEPHPRDS